MPDKKQGQNRKDAMLKNKQAGVVPGQKNSRPSSGNSSEQKTRRKGS